MRKKGRESGMVIVEATIVFPVMFLVIFLMIFAGNAYLQKCRVEALVSEMAIDGAAYCADPMLDEVESGTIPAHTTKDIIQPYRYLIGGMNDVEAEIETNLTTKISELSTGLFSNMKPSSAVVDVKYNNGFIYSTFSVEVEYKIEIPVRLLGASDYIALQISTRSDIPVSDTTELIRNIDMIEDYMEKFGVKEKLEEGKAKVTEMVEKAKEWFNKGN